MDHDSFKRKKTNQIRPKSLTHCWWHVARTHVILCEHPPRSYLRFILSICLSSSFYLSFVCIYSMAKDEEKRLTKRRQVKDTSKTAHSDVWYFLPFFCVKIYIYTHPHSRLRHVCRNVWVCCFSCSLDLSSFGEYLFFVLCHRLIDKQRKSNRVSVCLSVWLSVFLSLCLYLSLSLSLSVSLSLSLSPPPPPSKVMRIADSSLCRCPFLTQWRQWVAINFPLVHCNGPIVSDYHPAA